MRHLGIGAIIVVLAACGSSAARTTSTTSTSSARGHAATVPCGPPGARTLAADSVSRIYARGAVAYGCAAGAPTSFRLGQTRSCLGTPRVGPVAVAGRTAAYALERCGVDMGTTRVVVRRLSDGQQQRSASALTKPVGVESYQSVTSLVLKRDGAVAWIAVGTSIASKRSGVEVHKADTHGQRLLDSGSAVRRRSLQLHDSTLTWRHGAAGRSATLH